MTDKRMSSGARLANAKLEEAVLPVDPTHLSARGPPALQRLVSGPLQVLALALEASVKKPKTTNVLDNRGPGASGGGGNSTQHF